MKLHISPELAGSAGTVHAAAARRVASRARCRLTNAARCLASWCRLKYAVRTGPMFRAYCSAAAMRVAFCSAVQLALALPTTKGLVIPDATKRPAAIVINANGRANRLVRPRTCHQILHQDAAPKTLPGPQFAGASVRRRKSGQSRRCPTRRQPLTTAWEAARHAETPLFEEPSP